MQPIDLVEYRLWATAKAVEASQEAYSFLEGLSLWTRLLGISLILSVAIIALMGKSLKDARAGKEDMTKKERKKYVDAFYADKIVDFSEQAIIDGKLTPDEVQTRYWQLAKCLRLNDIRPRRLSLIPNETVANLVRDRSRLLTRLKAKGAGKNKLNGFGGKFKMAEFAKPKLPGDKPATVATPRKENKIKTKMV